MAGRDEERAVVRALVDAHGETYAEEAGIRLRDTPQPLYRLLVLAHLLSARIKGSIAVASARALHEAQTREMEAVARLDEARIAYDTQCEEELHRAWAVLGAVAE